eukprot:1207226-Prymnesium_polylepis.1
MGAPADATPAQLSDAAFARGLQLPAAAAERFVENALSDEAARVALADAGCRELQQQLRTRVAPPQVTEATMPQRGETAGSGALPGPQPGMATQELQPAQLEAVVEQEEAAMEEDGGKGDSSGGANKRGRKQKDGSDEEKKKERRKYKSEKQAEYRQRDKAAKESAKEKDTTDELDASDILRDLRNYR